MERAAAGNGRGAGGRGLWLLAFAVAAAASLFAYRSCLRGDFISDDQVFLVANPFTAQLSAENLREIVDPGGAAGLLTVSYAPLHLLVSALEVRLFGAETLGYHLLNVLLHAGNAVLFAALLAATGAPLRAALLSGLIFALHPANVEAVAWMSQLKTLLAFGLGFGAVLCLERRPLLATLLFAAALLSKVAAAALLCMAAVLVWTRGGGRRAWAWLAAWAAIAGLVALAQLAAFAEGGSYLEPAFEDRFVQLRTMAAVGARYLPMAATSWGLSAYHEPPPALSWTDPWWLAALPIAALLAARLVFALRRRRAEAAWWTLAAASFAPVSQIVPFHHAMADRYLYFILPGLIGGALFLGLELRARLAPRLGAPLGSAALAGALVLAVFFGWRTQQRAFLWQRVEWLLADAAGQYPEGSKALYVRAVNAAQAGDVAAAVAALREADARRKLSRVHQVERDPWLAPLHGTPEFRAYLREVARDRIELARQQDLSSPAGLRWQAGAHAVLGEHDQAIALLEQAIRADERLRPALLIELEQLRAERRKARAAGADRSAGR